MTSSVITAIVLLGSLFTASACGIIEGSRKPDALRFTGAGPVIMVIAIAVFVVCAIVLAFETLRIDHA